MPDASHDFRTKYALGLVGTPWSPGGRELNVGVDCWGLVRHVYAVCLGITLPAYPNVDPTRTDELVRRMEEGVRTEWTELDEPEDWVGVGLSSGRLVHHVGVWLAGGVLHAVPSTGVVYQTTNGLRMAGLRCIQFWKHDRHPSHQ